MMAAYYHASKMFQSGPRPPPPELHSIVDKTAEYVAKNGDHFERTLILKHLMDSRFEFLHPWNEYNAYYKAKITETRQELQREMERSMPTNTQRLQSCGSVSFKVTVVPKTPQLTPRPTHNMEGEGEESDEEDDVECNGKRKCTERLTRFDVKKPKMTDKDTTFKVTCLANK